MTSTPDEIASLVERQDQETRTIRQDLVKMCWHMRGGLTYNEAAQLSYQEREIIGELIKENLETTKKTGMPYY